MPVTTDYLETLKIQLEAAATNKKAALDAAYERATNVQFDTEGKMSVRKTPAGNEAGPGTLDVQYAAQQKNIDVSNEASGTLKSGQYGRDLATSQAGYRSTIAGLNAERISGKSAADTDAASELAKYKAMYGTPTPSATPTTGGGTTTAAGGGGGGTQKPADPTGNTPTTPPVTPPPIFEAVAPVNTIPESTYTDMTPQQKAAVITRNDAVDASGYSGFGATAPVVKKPAVTPPKKLVPVSNKVKTISSTRM